MRLYKILALILCLSKKYTKYTEDLFSKTPIKTYGVNDKLIDAKKIIRLNDLWHTATMNHIKDVAQYLNKIELNYIEIGSGFGGLAEKNNLQKLV